MPEQIADQKRADPNGSTGAAFEAYALGKRMESGFRAMPSIHPVQSRSPARVQSP